MMENTGTGDAFGTSAADAWIASQDGRTIPGETPSEEDALDLYRRTTGFQNETAEPPWLGDVDRRADDDVEFSDERDEIEDASWSPQTYVIGFTNWSDQLAIALKKAQPGDRVIVRTEPMRLLAEQSAADRGKRGVEIIIADQLED
jgi:hypothetical protein